MPDDGPTDLRLAHAGIFHTATGRSRSSRRYSMYDDALGRAWMRRKISDEEYTALGRYAYHWASGGLRGAIQSIDLDRVFFFNPASMTGLAKSERQADHRAAYHAARLNIGRRPAMVADSVACFDMPLVQVGLRLGYHSEAHAREAAREVLCEAGYRLGRFWKDRDTSR
jgi:hypothetical protein